jgi:hypothetical protein
VTPDEFSALIAESRRLSGVPRFIEDPATVNLLATLLLEGEGATADVA